MVDKYDFINVERAAQALWDHEHAFACNDSNMQKPVYVLGMFPYPSGSLHMGHLRNYTITDVIARFHRALGSNVLHPTGWDAFGLPAENAARESKKNPAEWTMGNIETMKSQLRDIGISYDWQRSVTTCTPEYYRYEQELFVKLMQDGTAYRKLASVNWDPIDNTVLANEQVVDGRGWRSGALVEKRELQQWFLRISDYADELYDAINALDHWPDSVKNMQREWIGKSYGCEIDFAIDSCADNMTVFTTRPETLFGAVFCAISTGHQLAMKWAEDNVEIKCFIDAHNSVVSRHLQKEAVATGHFAIHPFTGERLPIYVANFILADYATGAIFGCPAHDARDLELATKFGLALKTVIIDDHIHNSDFLDGLPINDARIGMINAIVERKLGGARTYCKLKDWGVSRQRYWGCPIPVIYCNKCGILPAKDLPITLPTDVDFSASGNPLYNHPTWKHVMCYECNMPATRETDTFDTFFESSWYFLALASPNRSMIGANSWMPVDYYVGGIEHAILHLLYARYFMRLLNKYGYVKCTEPFHRLITQGMVCHKTYQTLDGTWITPEEGKKLSKESVLIGPSVKMSKSKKNVVSPLSVMTKYGADAARLFIMSDTPIDKQLEWSDQGLDGALRFLRKLWVFAMTPKNINADLQEQYNILRKTHIAIADVTSAIRTMSFNVAIARLREFTNFLFDINEVCSYDERATLENAVRVMLRLAEPFIPHITQVLWANLGNNGLLCFQPWPEHDASLIEDSSVRIVVQVLGSMRAVIEVPKGSSEDVVRIKALENVKVKDKISSFSIKKVIFVQDKVINFILG